MLEKLEELGKLEDGSWESWKRIVKRLESFLDSRLRGNDNEEEKLGKVERS